jgi:hypothetical protein
MPEQKHGYGPPKVEGYTATFMSEQHRQSLFAGAEGTAPQIKVTFRGEGFKERALMPVVKFGDQRAKHCEISADERSLTCYLDTLPAEGAVIQIGYGGEDLVELPERFSQNKVERGALDV